MNNDTNLEQPPMEAAGEQPAGGGGPGGRPPIRRTDGILGGVAAGIARHFNVEPWLIRLAFILMAIPGGVGIIAYLAGWLIIPKEDTEESIVESWLHRYSGGSLLGMIVIGVAVIWILGSIGTPESGLPLALGLLIFGVLLYRGDLPGRKAAETAATPDAGATPPTPPQPQVGGESMPSQTMPPLPPAAGLRPPVPPTPGLQPPVPPTPKPPRPRSILGRLTFSAILIALGGLALLSYADVLFPDVRHYFALAVLVTGVGLLVGAFWGRSRALIALGLILAFGMGIATVAETIDEIEARTERYVPVTVAEIGRDYNLSAGSLLLDLSNINLEGGTVAIDAEVGAGEIEVILPEGHGATISARAGVGQVDVLGSTSEGLGVGRTVSVAGTSGTFDLDLRVGVGQVTVIEEVRG